MKSSSNWGLRAIGLAGAVVLVGVTGCNLMPLSDSERQQMLVVRAFKNSLSPTSNKPLGVALREIGTLLSDGIPSRYGVETTDYMQAFPSVTIPSPTVQVQPQFDAHNDLLKLWSGTNLVIEAAAQQTDQTTCVYTMTAKQTPTGTTAKLTVTTSGNNWTGSTTPARYSLNLNRSPQVLSGLDAAADLVLPQGAGQAQLRASLSSFDQSSGNFATPRYASFSFLGNNAKLLVQLSGAYGGQTSATLSGTTTFSAGSSNESLQTQISATGQSVHALFTSDTRKIRIELTYDGGKLIGEAKATDGRLVSLATFTHEGGTPQVHYADGTAEPWNFTLPPI